MYQEIKKEVMKLCAFKFLKIQQYNQLKQPKFMELNDKRRQNEIS